MKFKTGLMLSLAFTAGAVSSAGFFKDFSPISSLKAYAEETIHDDTNNAETIRLLTLLGTVMDVVRTEYVEPLSDKKLINNALDGMVGNLDPHSAYMTPEQLHDMQDQISGQFGGLGLQVQSDGGHVRIISPIDGTPAAKAGILPGDVITMVDHKSIADLTLDQAVKKMRGKPGTKIVLTILRPKTGKIQTIPLTREIIHVQIVRSALYGRTAYIRLSEFDTSLEHEMRAAYLKLVKDVAKTPGKTLNGLVLDLRSNPGGKLDEAINVSRDFIKEGEIVSIRGRNKSMNQHWDGTGKDITDGLPIVVLINAGSASASEIVSGALKDHHRALLLGERSFGKGSVQTIIPIADQGAVRLTTARYYTPSGRSIQGLGITPDIEVHESRDDDNEYTYHEADLAHVLSNNGASKDTSHTPLPAGIATIASKPPEKWSNFDPLKPETDFQLQQALHLLSLMNASSSSASPAPKEKP